MQTLSQILDVNLKTSDVELYKSIVPGFIYSNLKESFDPRPYQKEAFGRFDFYWNIYRKTKNTPVQLLYHMATGSGKTFIMAGLIIYLYEKGYRNFLFFVNSTNIIEKTKDNFLNHSSSKYLFANNISIGDKSIQIREVENFQSSNHDGIHIVFSTIQGLHSRLNNPRENSLTYDDFEDNKIVLISDEAHHLNAETKKMNELDAKEKDEMISWERTVNRIFNANAENVLLEFTATADLSLPGIIKKYNDKLIFDYPLKQFRLDGYSKEVKVLQADLSPFDRALQSMLLSQYRRKVFEKYGMIAKPVILFKSKTIKESESFFDEFVERLKKMKVVDLEKIKDRHYDHSIKKNFQFLDESHISLENFLSELKEDFSEDKLLSVNSKDESEQKQLAVNSLEDETNEYRAVFAVDKLNEGWDVLNLFDIVRLYDTTDVRAGKTGKTTMAEAQLIGRGARYFPFKIKDNQPLFERKFDGDISHELRICEELYYHSAYNPRYIQELNAALQQIGIKEKDIVKKSSNTTRKNKKESHEFIKIDTSAVLFELTKQLHRVNLRTGYSTSASAFDDKPLFDQKKNEQSYSLSDIPGHIVKKAINKLEYYQFSNLKKLLPKLNSISEFITSYKYLGNLQLVISGLQEDQAKLSPGQQLEICLEALNNISLILNSTQNLKK
ncbi:MAG: DEAD/DEAH box helicase family protein [Ginsengibacter sp.]